MEKYILTGGPGVGKTTLVDSLSQKGFMTVPEVARQIIAEEQRKEGVLPWTDLQLFQELVIERQLGLESKIGRESKVFLDRGLADTIAFMEIGNLPAPSYLLSLIEQAGYTRVFYLEPLPFYVQDKERKEDQDFAKRIHEQLYRVYDRLGFDIVTVPVCNNIEERVQFVLNETQQEKNREIERKYRINHDVVKKKLAKYVVKNNGVDHEENKLYDFYGLLKEAGCVLRIRENNGEHILTLKGPNRSTDFQNKTEYNISIPSIVSRALQTVLPESVYYSKRRENYKPLGDAHCTISLDYLPGLGEFVEIEAATENQVKIWEQRLGLSEYHIHQSYPALIRELRN